MNIKMILPALTEAKSPFWRPIKYSLFPPLGLATLAGYLDPDDEVSICDEHVENINTNDRPELVVIQVYITSTSRAYELADHYRARGSYVCLGGLHVTSLPDEAARYADSIFLGPGEDTWPAFLADYRAGSPRSVYRSGTRTLAQLPFPRRDLLKRRLYLVPNSIAVSRGCPNNCSFCYKTSFFKGGRSYYRQPVDRTLQEIESLPGRHLYFLDDNLLADEGFSNALFEGMAGMGRLWQAAGTVNAALNSAQIGKAVRCGLRSLFVGFESLSLDNLKEQGKSQEVRYYSESIARLHDAGVMVNASFVFGMDDDDKDVFSRTVDWAVRNGVETATFHILTPYPDTTLFRRMWTDGRITTLDWNRYDTRHAVFTPARMSAQELENGYRRAYREFYSWRNIFTSTSRRTGALNRLRHFAYKSGWKKFEPFWDLAIRLKQISCFTPLLEAVLGSDEAGQDSSTLSTKSAEERLLLSLIE